MTVQQYYSELSRREKMDDYTKGRRDCEQGIPHQNKSKDYTRGYNDQYHFEATLDGHYK